VGRIAGRRRSALLCVSIGVVCLVIGGGCRQDMQDQPKYVVYRESKSFKDDLSARPLVEGTVARGWLRADKQLYTGKMTAPTSVTPPSPSGSPKAGTAGTAPTGAGGTASQVDVDTFPFPITEQVMRRGKERFEIFCAVCHGKTGEGDGMIVRRGFRRPPSYYTEDLRKAPVGHFFDVVTNGWGTMPDYATQIPVQDRWAIIAYVRALQASNPKVVATPAPPIAANTTAAGGTK
jgi:mono/diheme cytochrome c family protein